MPARVAYGRIVRCHELSPVQPHQPHMAASRSTLTEYAGIKAALEAPGFYPHEPSEVTVIETHSSCVFLAGDRAYKLKRPVRLDFLDYSSRLTRRRMCREE